MTSSASKVIKLWKAMNKTEEMIDILIKKDIELTISIFLFNILKENPLEDISVIATKESFRYLDVRKITKYITDLSNNVMLFDKIRGSCERIFLEKASQKKAVSISFDCLKQGCRGVRSSHSCIFLSHKSFSFDRDIFPLLVLPVNRYFIEYEYEHSVLKTFETGEKIKNICSMKFSILDKKIDKTIADFE